MSVDETRTNTIKRIIFEELCIGLENGFETFSDIELTTHLQDDLDADSLDQVNVVMAIEDGLGIEIDDSQADGFTTVSDIVDAVNNHFIDEETNDTE